MLRAYAGNCKGRTGGYDCSLDDRPHTVWSVRCVASQVVSNRPAPETKPKWKAIKGILNQINPEKYEMLFAKLLAEGIADASLWDTLINMVSILL